MNNEGNLYVQNIPIFATTTTIRTITTTTTTTTTRKQTLILKEVKKFLRFLVGKLLGLTHPLIYLYKEKTFQWVLKTGLPFDLF